MSIKQITGVLAMMLWFEGHSQDKDLFHIDYTYTPVRSNDTSASAKIANVKIRMPVYKKNDLFVLTGESYRNVSMKDMPNVFNRQLHNVNIDLVGVYKINEVNSVSLAGVVSLNSEWRDIGSEDLIYSMAGSFHIKYSEYSRMGMGLAFSRQFFGNQVVPLLDMDYYINERWRITCRLPIHGRLVYTTGKRSTFGGGWDLWIISFRMAETDDYIRLKQLSCIAYYEYRFWKNWRLNFTAGFIPTQEFGLYKSNNTRGWTLLTTPIGEAPEPIQQVNNKGFILQTGLVLKFPEVKLN